MRQIGSSLIITCIYFPLKILSNDLVLLLQGRIRYSCVGKNRFIMYFNVRWPITRDSHHVELVDSGDKDLSSGGVNLLALKEVISAYAQLYHKDWDHTGKATTNI